MLIPKPPFPMRKELGESRKTCAAVCVFPELGFNEMFAELSEVRFTSEFKARLRCLAPAYGVKRAGQASGSSDAPFSGTRP